MSHECSEYFVALALSILIDEIFIHFIIYYLIIIIGYIHLMLYYLSKKVNGYTYY